MAPSANVVGGPMSLYNRRYEDDDESENKSLASLADLLDHLDAEADAAATPSSDYKPSSSTSSSSSASSSGSDESGTECSEMDCSNSSYDSNYTDTSCCTLLDQLEEDNLLTWPPPASRPGLLGVTRSKSTGSHYTPNTNNDDAMGAQRRMLMKTNVSNSTRALLGALGPASNHSDLDSHSLHRGTTPANNKSPSHGSVKSLHHSFSSSNGMLDLLHDDNRASLEEQAHATNVFESFLAERQSQVQTQTYISKGTTTAAAAAKTEDHPDSPHAKLEVLLQQAKISAIQIPSGFWRDYFVPITEERRANYTDQAARAVRSQDMATLQQMLEKAPPRKGETSLLDACNEQGETLIHHACRRHNLALIQLLTVDAHVSFKVQDDCGKTALHECCWAMVPAAPCDTKAGVAASTATASTAGSTTGSFTDSENEEDDDERPAHKRVFSFSSLYPQKQAAKAMPIKDVDDDDDEDLDDLDASMLGESSNHNRTTCAKSAATDHLDASNKNLRHPHPQANHQDWWDVNLMVLNACPELLWCPDERGHTPLQYIPRESWPAWNVFLEQHAGLVKAKAEWVRFQVAKYNLKTTLQSLS